MSGNGFMRIALICGLAFTMMHQSTVYADTRTHEHRKGECVLVHAQNIEFTSISLMPYNVHSTTFAFDHLFVCTASVPSIFVLPRVRYANPVNVLVTAPSKEVEARCNSPGKTV